MEIDLGDEKQNGTFLFSRCALKSSVILQGVTGHFRTPNSRDVVFGKENVLEVLEQGNDGDLLPLHEQFIFSTILAIDKLPNIHQGRDLLVILLPTHLHLLAYDLPTRRFVSISQVQTSSKEIGNQNVIAISSHPTPLIAVAAFEGAVAIYPIMQSNDTVAIQESFGESQKGNIWGLTFVETSDRFLVALRHRRPDNHHELIFFRISGHQLLWDSALSFEHSMGVPYHVTSHPTLPGKVFVFLEGQVALVSPDSRDVQRVSLPYPSLPLPFKASTRGSQTLIAASAWNPTGNSAELLLSTEHGDLYLVTLATPPASPIDFLPLGTTNPTTLLLPLQEDFLALPGDMCDGVVGKFNRSSMKLERRKTSLSNWGPLGDFQMDDIHAEGQDQLLGISGRGIHGALRVIRNGIAVSRLVDSELFVGVNGVWTFPQRVENPKDSFLVVSFATSTRVMTVTGSVTQPSVLDESPTTTVALEEVPEGLWDTEVPTLWAGLAVDDWMVQVTPKKVRLLHVEGLTLHHVTIGGQDPHTREWESQGVFSRAAVFHYSSQRSLVVVTQAKPNVLWRFHISTLGNTLDVSETQSLLSHESSALSFFSFSEENNVRVFLAVGTYVGSLQVWEDNKMIHEEMLKDPTKGAAIPHSLAVTSTTNDSREVSQVLWIGFRGGTVCHFICQWNETGLRLTKGPERRIGVVPVSFSKDSESLVALSDRPWRILSLRQNRFTFTSISFGRVFSPLPSHHSQVSQATHLRMEGSPEGLVFATETSLSIVQLETAKSLNVQRLPLFQVYTRRTHSQTPKRVCYDPSSQLVVVTTFQGKLHSGVWLVDPLSGEILTKCELQSGHVGTALYRWELGNRIFVIVGTTDTKSVGNVLPQGKVVLFEIAQQGNSWTLISRTWLGVPGNVSSVTSCHGEHLLCGVGAYVMFIRLRVENEELLLLPGEKVLCHFPVTSIACYLSRVAVGTQKEGLLFFALREEEEKPLRLELLERDIVPRMSPSVIMIDDNLAVGCDRLGNLFAVSYDSSTDLSTPKRKLRTECSFSLQETALTIRRVNLLPSSDFEGTFSFAERQKGKRSIVAGTMLGSVFVFLDLSRDEFVNLESVEKAMRKHSNLQLLPGNQKLFRCELQESRQVIDGDFLNVFLDLERDVQMEILKDSRLSMTTEDFISLLDSLNQRVI